jgi:nicotinate-nucleotide adenylyltransferase
MATARSGPDRAFGRGGRRIGLLGGSFNPAHDGHLHISRLAIRRLGLDQVWWMVSPQNPLKAAAGMAPLADRLNRARTVAAADRRIRVGDIETRLGTRYTIDTLRALNRHCPRRRFVWLMGADNLEQFPRWRDWAAIFETVPVAVFDRDTYSFAALAGKAAKRFARARVAPRNARRLVMAPPPAWVYFHTPRHPASATEIRARNKPAKA